MGLAIAADWPAGPAEGEQAALFCCALFMVNLCPISLLMPAALEHFNKSLRFFAAQAGLDNKPVSVVVLTMHGPGCIGAISGVI
jgi:hypothetical protein